MKKYLLLLRENKAFAYLLIASLALTVLTLSPMLKSGYVNDDYITSLINGNLQVQHSSLVQYFSDETSWLPNGRFYPLYFVGTYVIMAIINSLFAYKATILAAIVIDILAFGYLVWLLTGSKPLCLLSVLLMPVFLQFRFKQDPLLSYSLLMQLVFFYIITSLILLVLYLKKGRKGYLAASVFMYLLSLLTYEVSYPFCLLHIMVIYSCLGGKELRKIARISGPFVFAPALTSMPVLFMRIQNGFPITVRQVISWSPDYTYVPNLDPVQFVTTLAEQTFAAFPLSYYYLDPRGLFRVIGANIADSPVLLAIIAAIFFFSSIEVAMLFRREETRPWPIRNVKNLFFVGLLMTILPGILISLSPIHRMYIALDSGYLPVYISYFGVSMMIASALYTLLTSRAIAGKGRAFAVTLIFAAVLSAAGALNYDNNTVVVDYTNIYWNHPRSFIQSAMNNGLLDGVPDNSTLLVDSNYLWDLDSFYAMNSHKAIKYVGTRGNNTMYASFIRGFGANDLAGIAPAWKNGSRYAYDASDRDNIYYLIYDSSSEDEGYAILSGIRNLVISNDTIYGLTSQNAYVYVSHPYISYPYPEGRNVSLEGDWENIGGAGPFEHFRLGEKDMELVASGGDWKLFRVSRSDKLVDVLSLNVNVIQDRRGFSTFDE